MQLVFQSLLRIVKSSFPPILTLEQVIVGIIGIVAVCERVDGKAKSTKLPNSSSSFTKEKEQMRPCMNMYDANYGKRCFQSRTEIPYVLFGGFMIATPTFQSFDTTTCTDTSEIEAI